MQKKTLLVLTCLLSWWLMQAVHELGHVLGAIATGGYVERVVLNPSVISRTDVEPNLNPLWVVWAGPVFGVVFPFLIWACVTFFNAKLKFFHFFAGFCFIANGLYIGIGSLEGIGDAGVMIRHGSPIWSLWFFGGLASVAGFSMWHFLGPGFGLKTMDSQSVDFGLRWIGTACMAYFLLTILVF